MTPEEFAAAMVAELTKNFPEMRFVLIVAAPKDGDEDPHAFALGAASSLRADDTVTALDVARDQFAGLCAAPRLTHAPAHGETVH